MGEQADNFVIYFDSVVVAVCTYFVKKTMSATPLFSIPRASNDTHY